MDRIARTILAITTDQNSINNTLQQIERVERGSIALDSSFADLGDAIGFESISRRFDSIHREIEDQQFDLETLRREWDDVTEAADRAAQAQQKAALDTSNILPFGDETAAQPARSSRVSLPAATRGNIDAGSIGAVTGQLLSGLGAGEAANAAGLIGDVAEAFETLSPAALGVTGVLGIATIAFAAISAELEKNARLAEAYFKRQSELAAVLESGVDSSAIRENIDAREEEYRVIERQIAQYQPLVDSLEQVTRGQGDYLSFFRQLEAGTDDQVKTVGALLAEYERLTTESNNLSNALDDLYLSLGSTEVAAADATAANRERAAALQAAADQEIAYANLIATGTSEAVQGRIDAIQRELEALYPLSQELQSLQTAYGGYEDALAENAARIDQLTAENATLQLSVQPLIEQRETEAEVTETLRGIVANFGESIIIAGEAVGGVVGDLLAQAREIREAFKADAYQAYFDAITVTIDAQAELAAAQRDYNEVVIESAARTLELQAETDAQIQEIQLQAAADLRDAEADASEERLKAAETLLKAMARAEDAFARDSQRAIRSRDVAAYEQATEKFEEQAKQADEAYQEQLEQIDDRLQAQIDMVRERVEEQTRVQRDGLERQIENLRAATQRELQTKQQAINQAQVNLQNALNSERALQFQFYNLERQAYVTHINALSNYLFSAGGQMVGALSAGINAALLRAQSTGSGTGGGRTTPTQIRQIARDEAITVYRQVLTEG